MVLINKYAVKLLIDIEKSNIFEIDKYVINSWENVKNHVLR
jgi:hypothetical protein